MEQHELTQRKAGRPRAFDRDQALGIALELFWRHGFAGTSTTQLAESMGIAQTSLYAAFGSKEALYREAVALYLARHGDFISGPLTEELPAYQAMERIVLGAARQFAEPGHPPGCMIACAELRASSGTEALALEMAEFRRTARSAVQERLERARLAKELPAEVDTAALAAYYAAVMQGMSIQAHDGASAAVLEHIAKLAMLAWPGRKPRQRAKASRSQA